MSFFYKYKIDKYIFFIGEENGFITYITLDKINGYELKETLVIKRAKVELEEYFLGKRKEFDLPIKLKGTDFQKRVWEEMRNISYGKTISYKTLALRVNSPLAFRAIGQVCHNNKILIVIPCHRVIGVNSLGGFRGGLDMKIRLLELEGNF